METLTYRTHTCGALRQSDAGASVVLLGWVHRVRDLGGVLFFDIRDRYGITQVVLREPADSAGQWQRVARNHARKFRRHVVGAFHRSCAALSDQWLGRGGGQ